MQTEFSRNSRKTRGQLARTNQHQVAQGEEAAFAVAAEVDPDILVVDEILAVGDAPFQAKCFERLAKFRQRGKTILYVSHAMGNVLNLCNRAILLEAGRMTMDGAPADVVERYMPGTLALAQPAAVP